ncbi:LH1 [Bovine adenovirus 7]|uniref:LH1 protein n=1 Tax=Bovine adenovirus 7 TaxID=10511 RepID=A0A7R7FRH8_ADEB7|nr:LH1 [Bovine adenovirus 7]BCS90510.1 LH1 [Bovine adenovirus 7]
MIRKHYRPIIKEFQLQSNVGYNLFPFFDSDSVYCYILDEISWICLKNLKPLNRMWFIVCLTLCKEKFNVNQYIFGDVCYVLKSGSNTDWILPYLDFITDFLCTVSNTDILNWKWICL